MGTPVAVAKYQCREVTFAGPNFTNETKRTYTFGAVYDTTVEENRRFTKATPWGELRITVDNPEVSFDVGTDYYLTFTPAG